MLIRDVATFHQSAVDVSMLAFQEKVAGVGELAHKGDCSALLSIMVNAFTGKAIGCDTVE